MTTVRFLFSSILTDECDGSVMVSSMASNSLGAPEEMQRALVSVGHILAPLKLP